MDRTILRGGTIVTPDQTFRGDISILGETIAQVAPEIPPADSQLIDITGLYVLPGVIDAHVHLRDPGATHKEDWATGTRAALAGGVTTVLDMPNNPIPTTTRHAVAAKNAIARAKAVCDYGLFVGATPGNYADIGDMGGVGVKLYMGATTGDLLVTDFDATFHHFGAPHNLPIVVHAEDDEALRFYSAEHADARHSEKRPPLAAAVAVSRALALAESTGRQLHIAHLSTVQELEQVVAARTRGVHVTFEVTPQHLFLSTEDEERLGPFGIVNPPLRSLEHVRALWHDRAYWDMVATDHAPHTLEEKTSARPPSGMPGLETMLPLLLGAANEGRLSLNDIARLTARNPARVFHLRSKGEIAPGHDADLTLVRLDEEYTLGKPWQTRCNWSPFEGRHVRGKIARVYLRGREVIREERILAEPGSGTQVHLI